MSAITKTKLGSSENYKELLLSKREELINRLSKRRSQVAIEQEVDDEGAVALQSVIRDLTMTNLEREIRTLGEVELCLRLLNMANVAVAALRFPRRGYEHSPGRGSA